MSNSRQFNYFWLQLQQILNKASKSISIKFLSINIQFKIIAKETELSFLTEGRCRCRERRSDKDNSILRSRVRLENAKLPKTWTSSSQSLVTYTSGCPGAH